MTRDASSMTPEDRVLQHRIRFAVLIGLVFASPSLLLAQDGWRRHRRESAHIRIGGHYTVPAATTLDGPLLMIGGSARLDGTVEDDVTTIGGHIEVGPSAIIDGDLNAVGGHVTIDPAARVTGEVNEITAGWGALPVDVGDIGPRVGAWLSAWLTVVRLSLVFLAGLMLAALAPAWMRPIGERASATPGRALLAGAGTEILMMPAVVALAVALIITIVGIPLLAAIPVLLGLLAILWVAGFTGVAIRVGRAMRGGRAEAPIAEFTLGFLAVCSVTMLAHLLPVSPGWFPSLGFPVGAIGIAVEYIAWTLGLGAAVLSVVGRNRGLVPPPLPPRVDDAASAPA